MKIRLIIIIFALLAFLTASVGGYVYYHSVRENALRELHKDTDGQVVDCARRIDLYIAEHHKMTAALAGLREVQRAVTDGRPGSRAAANSVLDHFQRALAVDVCYLIDRTGVTIASSNRTTPETFVGKNYAFRPYFKQAMEGKPTVYMALGVTSGKPGVYYSCPVYDERHTVPIGVVVTKSDLEHMESGLLARNDGVSVLADPNGVVFISSRHDWLYHVLWEVSPDTLSEIAASQQFGTTPPQWTGLKKSEEGYARDGAGNSYMVHDVPLQSYKGWKVLFFHDLGIVTKQISGTVFRKTGAIILLICVMIGTVCLVLYNKANKEIRSRKKIEEELKNTNTTLQAMIKASPLPIVGVDAAGNTIQWNPAAERVFGWSEAEVLGLPPRIIPRDLQQEHITFRNKIIDDDKVTGVETRRMKKDGTLIDVTVSSATIHDEQGTGVAAMGIYEDITERKRAEDEVRFLAGIIQNLPDAVCAIDTSGIVVTWNNGATRMLGYSAEDIIGRPVTAIIPEDMAQREFDHCLVKLNAEGYFTGYESVRVDKEGRRIPVELTAVAIRDHTEKITHYASIMIDLRDRKKAHEEKLKVHMLESIGLLAGGIAHDFNNLLTSIIGNIEVAKLSLSPDDKAYDRLDDAARVCQLASELSRKLITFATGGDPLRRPMLLSGLLAETVTSLLHGSSIDVELKLGENLHEVAADEGQMKQVFINLAMNAKEAMPQGGTLVVRGENIHVSADDKVPMREGDYLAISFKDNGAGIPSENLAKIFDPYYSTKDTYSQKGLGLGLAVCYSVIKRHKGLITVQSQAGEGTTFQIYLPAVMKKENA